MRSFLKGMCDPHHYLSIYLHELTLQLRTVAWDSDDFDGDDESDSRHDVLEPVVRMLDTNRTLRKIVLIFKLDENENHSSRKAINAVFKRQLGELWIPTKPLETSSKLAFLSAFHGANAMRPEGLDSNIFAIIFRFAAPCVRRQFHLEIQEEHAHQQYDTT